MDDVDDGAPALEPSPIGRPGTDPVERPWPAGVERDRLAGLEPDGSVGPVGPGGAAGVERDRLSGVELGRAALEVARAASRRSPRPNPRRVAGRRGPGAEQRRGGYSGAGPDPRDPQPFGRLVRRLVTDRGWEQTTANATVLGNWDRVVGPELAARCQPVSLREGELTLAAESTAWAMQLRGMLPVLMTRIRAELGPDVVRRIRVHGPTAPTWGAGPRRIAGRGPRDTYG